MIESILVVLSRPQPGQDDEANDWYSNIHLHDALRCRGSIASQRFKLSDKQIDDYRNPSKWKFLALYEVSDTVRFTREHVEATDTVRMQVALAFDHTVTYDYYFSPCHFLDNAPDQPVDGNVVLQQIGAKPGQEREFRRWYARECLIPAVARSGVRSGALLQYRTEGQMQAGDPDANFVAIYRLSAANAMDNWPGLRALATSSLVAAGTIATSCWEPLIPRLTKDEVLHPTSALLAAEERARARMGSKILKVGTWAGARQS